MTHHPYGFSRWPALKLCAHYESDDRKSKSSENGTSQHGDLADFLFEANTGTPASGESEGAAWAARFIVNRKNEDDCSPDVQIQSESEVGVGEGKVAEGVFGTCDAWYVTNDGRLRVFDFKSGARTNVDYMPQVMGYAYAIYSSSGEALKPVDIECYVLYGASREVVAGKFTYGDLLENARVVMEHVDGKEIYKPVCNGCCQYCIHKMECSAMTAEIVKFRENPLLDMGDAAKYDWLSCAKDVIEKEMDAIKERTIANGGSIQDGDIRYEIRRDSRGKVKSTNINDLFRDAEENLCVQDYRKWMEKCSLSKKNFVELMKDSAKSNGVKATVKDIEELYVRNSTFGEPAAKMVRV